MAPEDLASAGPSQAELKEVYEIAFEAFRDGADVGEAVAGDTTPPASWT